MTSSRSATKPAKSARKTAESTGRDTKRAAAPRAAPKTVARGAAGAAGDAGATAVSNAGPAGPAWPPRRRHVALIVETSLAPGREMLRGIARYVREHGHWATFLEPRSLEESVPSWLETWRGDGIIARVQTPQIARAVLATGLPVVDVLGVVPADDLPLVHTDDTKIALLAFEHLRERGYRRFGFFGLAGESWSQHRCEAFRDAAREADCPCTVYEVRREVHHTRMWEEYADDLARWVAGLPKPVGLMACSDQCGPVLMEACRRAGVAVPDEAAVIGVDNDETLCEVSDPPLSSVWPDHTRVGYEAAALLDRLMSGDNPGGKSDDRRDAAKGAEAGRGRRPMYVPPKGVVTRQSTDALAIEDRDVAAAVRFIRHSACEGPTIDDVAAHVLVSRSVLQRRFRRVVGHTIHEEMLRVRIERARQLLAETDLPIAVVAERAGFSHQEYLGVVFRRRLGVTPARFRAQNRR